MLSAESKRTSREQELQDKMFSNEPLPKDVEDEQELEGNKLPTIDEELARIFPDSADKFLKPAKKRGRPRKEPKTDIKDDAKRDVGRPRKAVSSLLFTDKKKTHGKVGRPRKIPLKMTGEAAAGVPLRLSVLCGKVGRPRKIPLQTTVDTNGGMPFSHSVSRGKVGRPRKIPFQMANVGVTDTVNEETNADGSKRQSPFDNSIELQKLRKKPRLSYVETYIEDDEDDDEDDEDDEISFKSFGNLHSQIAGPKRGRGRPRKDEVLKRTLMVKLERLSDLNIDLRNQNASFMVKDLKEKGQGYLLPGNSGLRRKPGRPKKLKGESYVQSENNGLRSKPGHLKKVKGQGYWLAKNFFLKRRRGRPKMLNGKGCLPHLPSESNFLKRRRGRPKKVKVEPDLSITELDASSSNLTPGNVVNEKMTTVCMRVKRLDEVNMNQCNKTETVNNTELVEDELESNVTEDIYESGKPEDIGINEEMGDFSLIREVDNLQDTQNFYLNQEVVPPMASHSKRGRPKRKETSVQKSEKKRGRPRKEDTMPKRPRGRPKKFLKKSHALVCTQIQEGTGSVITEEVISPASPEFDQTKKQDYSVVTPTLSSPSITEGESSAKDGDVSPVESEDRVNPLVEPNDLVIPPVDSNDLVVPPLDSNDIVIPPVEPLRIGRGRGRPKGSLKRNKKRGCWRKISENSEVANVLEETRGMELSTRGHDIGIEEDFNRGNLKNSDRCCLATNKSLLDSTEILKKLDQEQCSAENNEVMDQVHGTGDTGGYSVEINDTYSSSDSEGGKTLNEKQHLSNVLPAVNGSPTTSENSPQNDSQLFDSENHKEGKQTKLIALPEVDLSVTEHDSDTHNERLHEENPPLPEPEHTVSDLMTDSESRIAGQTDQCVSGKEKIELLTEVNQSASVMPLNDSDENNYARNSPVSASDSDVNMGKISPVCKSQIELITSLESGFGSNGNQSSEGNQSVEGNPYVEGFQSVEGNQSVKGNQLEGNPSVEGFQSLEGNQSVEEKQMLDDNYLLSV